VSLGNQFTFPFAIYCNNPVSDSCIDKRCHSYFG